MIMGELLTQMKEIPALEEKSARTELKTYKMLMRKYR